MRIQFIALLAALLLGLGACAGSFNPATSASSMEPGGSAGVGGMGGMGGHGGGY